MTLDLKPEHAIAYAQLEKDTFTVLDGKMVHALNTLNLMTELMKLATTQNGSKMDYLLELLPQLKNRRVVVLSKFAKLLQWLRPKLEKLGLEVCSFHGDAKTSILEEFTSHSKPMVLLMTITKGGEGHTIPAEIAIFLDKAWRYETNKQALARMVGRLGQSKSLVVFDLLSRNTIEDYINEVIERGQSASEMLVGYKARRQHG